MPALYGVYPVLIETPDDAGRAYVARVGARPRKKGESR